jgi:DNA-binding NtrC family response regulator
MAAYLIVDDNRAFAENLAEILTDAGCEVTVAADATEALDQVKARKFDALLTDMRMPAMSGAQLVHEVRRVDPGLPALVVTAYSENEELRVAQTEGLLAVLSKPLAIPLLMALLESARRDGLVVMVEDDAAYADNLAQILRAHGYTAVLAASLLETERLGQLKPFAAIVDLRVPQGPDGEAMRRLAAQFPGMPLLVATGHDLQPPLPPHRLFRKPFDPADLLSELDRLYARR